SYGKPRAFFCRKSSVRFRNSFQRRARRRQNIHVAKFKRPRSWTASRNLQPRADGRIFWETAAFPAQTIGNHLSELAPKFQGGISKIEVRRLSRLKQKPIYL